MCATALAYATSYRRTLRKIVEDPDIAPAYQHARLPRFGSSFETAIGQFSVRSLVRSRQHRMIFAFYLGVAFAFAILFLNAPLEISGPAAGDPWHRPSVPLLASTIIIMGFSVVGARVVFSLPLDLRANWIFRVMPFRAGRQCLSARRRALLALSVAPAWAISAAVLIPLWPWRATAAHLAVFWVRSEYFLPSFLSAALKRFRSPCASGWRLRSSAGSGVERWFRRNRKATEEARGVFLFSASRMACAKAATPYSSSSRSSCATLAGGRFSLSEGTLQQVFAFRSQCQAVRACRQKGLAFSAQQSLFMRRVQDGLLPVIGAMMAGDLGGAVQDADIGVGGHQGQRPAPGLSRGTQPSFRPWAQCRTKS